MATITVHVTDEEKEFLTGAAKLAGVSLSELLRTTTLEAIDNQYDARLGDEVYQEFLQGARKTISLDEALKEYKMK